MKALPSGSGDLVEGYISRGSANLLGAAFNCGKTAFFVWMLAEIQRTGTFLGKPAQLPRWVRVFVTDRGRTDWETWCSRAQIPVPEGYWLKDDPEFSLDTLDESSEKGGKGAADRAFLAHFHMKVLDMRPEPGGLLLVDVGTPLLGEANSGYKTGFANSWRFLNTVKKAGLTSFTTAHSGKQQFKGGKDSKARYIDRINLSTGTMGTFDTICYLSSREELGEADQPADYQIFSWTPHHAAPETHRLARTEDGLFMPYEEPQPISQEAQRHRVGVVKEILGMNICLRKEVVQAIMQRENISQSSAYELLKGLEKLGIIWRPRSDAVAVKGVEQ